MLKLKKGIGLYSSLQDGFDRVYINSGTLPYKEQELQPIKFGNWDFVPLFHDKAYVPRHDWRALAPIELAQLNVNTRQQDYNSIFIGDTPAELKQIFEELEITDLTSREEVMARIRERGTIVKKMSDGLQNFLFPKANNKPFKFNCIAANLPNLELVACDISKLHPGFTVPERKYEGLHNDGTKFMKIHTVHKAGNRITINLGKQSRFFYFINLSLIQVFNMIKSKLTFEDEKISIYNIAPYFFKYFPDYPVIKIIQKPYEYYIAPTDNCFHDGSTLGNTSLDINMVYFGSFTC